MAIDAITTATQNLAVAFNNNARTTGNIAGQVTSQTYTGPLTVNISPGVVRLANVSVVVSGSGSVSFYNNSGTVNLVTNQLLFVLAPSSPIGITQVGINFSIGLTLVIGSGVSLNCTYSQGTNGPVTQ